MWEAYRLYLLAFAIYTITAIVTAILQAVAIRYDESSILAPIATTLSGNFLGGFALVLGILRDDRTAKQRERADKAEGQIKKLQEENQKYRQQRDEAQQLAEQERAQAQAWVEQERAQAQARVEQERARAEQVRAQVEQERLQERERAQAELQRVRAEYDREIAERFRRLEAVTGITPPAATDADAAGSDQSESTER